MDIKELKKQLADEQFKSVDFVGFECHEHGNLIVCLSEKEDFKGVLLYNRKTEEYEYFGDSLNSFANFGALQTHFFRKGMLEKLPQVFNLESDFLSIQGMEDEYLKNGNIFLTPRFLFDLRGAFPASYDTKELIEEHIENLEYNIRQVKVGLEILSHLLDDVKEEARNKTAN